MAIDKYLNNITSQHRDKPNFIAWLSAFLQKIDGGYTLLQSFDSNMDIDNAIGNQLDMLGQMIGRKRTLNFQPMNGFSPILTDDYYRLVLKTKIAMNNWDGTVESMYTIWNNIFGDDNLMDLQLQDNQDMSFNAYITGYIDQIQQNLIANGYIIPKPEGVRVNYIERSKIDFKLNYSMVVCSASTQTIVMSFDQTEKIYATTSSSMIIGQLKTQSISLNNKGVNYMIDQNGNYIVDENANQIIVT